MPEPFKLYASDETKAGIPTGDWEIMQKLIPQWAGKNVVLVSAADTNPPQKSPEGIFLPPDQQYTQHFRDFLNQLPLKNDLPLALPVTLRGAFAEVTQGRFTSRPFPSFESTGLITTVSNAADTKKIETPRFAGLPADMLGNIPGSSTDWLLAIMAHESGHLNTMAGEIDDAARFEAPNTTRYKQNAFVDVHNRNQTDEETRADNLGLNNYFNLCAQQTTCNPQVPQALLDLRAIGTIRNTGDTLSSLYADMSDHDTNPALQITGNTVQRRPDITSGDIGAAAIAINTKADLLLGLEFASPENTEAGRLKAESILSSLDLTLPEGAGVTQNAIGKDRYDLFKKIAEDPEGKKAMATLAVGNIIAGSKPLLQYAAVKFLYDHGEFKSDQEKLVAKQYIDAFEKYVPSAKNAETTAFIAQLETDRDKIKTAAGGLAGLHYITESTAITKKQLAEQQVGDSPLRSYFGPDTPPDERRPDFRQPSTLPPPGA